MQIFIKFLGAQKSLEQLVKTVNGKTVYLAKITDKLITKVNNLQSSLRSLDSTFLEWKTKIQAFATHENCHHNNYIEFLSKFSLEIARTFSTQLCFTETNDILHQAHKLHNKQLVSFADLPSFLTTRIQHQLHSLPSLQHTLSALEAGYPILLQPFVDYQYNIGKSMAINILFTIPELTPAHAFCTIEYLTPLKYNISGTCFQDPITRNELAFLHCPHAEFILKRTLLDKCYHTDDTFVCPQHILKTVNDTQWLGLPWNKNAKLNFVRRHQQAPDCSDLHNLYHLGSRYYLSTQQGLLPVFNTTDGPSHLISLTPLTVYHFPCELTFTTQQTGLGTCPHRITLHLPYFSSNSFRYIPWQNDDDDLYNYITNRLILHLHFNSIIKHSNHLTTHFVCLTDNSLLKSPQ